MNLSTGFATGIDTQACTIFRMKVKEGNITFARSMEWGISSTQLNGQDGLMKVFFGSGDEQQQVVYDGTYNIYQ